MLVLSRNKNERVVIGDGENRIVITIADVRGDRVRLGIQAPADVPVHREEVYETIHTSRKQDVEFKQLTQR